MDKLSFAIEDFKNIQELIRFIDQKAGALLVIYGVIITAFIEFSKGLVFVNPFSYTTGHKVLFSVATFVSGLILLGICLYQIYFIIFRIIEPKLDTNYKKDEVCLYYFRHIAMLSREDFISRFDDMNETDEMFKYIVSQIYEVSKIMNEKRENLCRSTKLVFSSVLILLVFIGSTKLI